MSIPKITPAAARRAKRLAARLAALEGKSDVLATRERFVLESRLRSIFGV